MIRFQTNNSLRYYNALPRALGPKGPSPKALREWFQPRSRRRLRRRESAVETASLGLTARADGPNAELRVQINLRRVCGVGEGIVALTHVSLRP